MLNYGQYLGDPTLTATPTPLAYAMTYTHVGDGNLVKSVGNGVTTYYPNPYYEKRVEELTAGRQTTQLNILKYLINYVSLVLPIFFGLPTFLEDVQWSFYFRRESYSN